jgi:hypothetical protein
MDIIMIITRQSLVFPIPFQCTTLWLSSLLGLHLFYLPLSSLYQENTSEILPHDLPGEFADVAVAVWDGLEGSFQSFDHDLDKLVYDYIAFFRVFLELDMLFIVPEKCEEKSLVKGVSLEIALEKFLDVDVPKILDGKLCILEKDY